MHRPSHFFGSSLSTVKALQPIEDESAHPVPRFRIADRMICTFNDMSLDAWRRGLPPPQQRSWILRPGILVVGRIERQTRDGQLPESVLETGVGEVAGEVVVVPSIESAEDHRLVRRATGVDSRISTELGRGGPHNGPLTQQPSNSTPCTR